MKRTFIIFLLAALSCPHIHAQTTEDALRYSRVFYSGTARFNAVGGAFGAVGADFSTVAINPAGLGLYNKSEMTFTLAPTVGNTNSQYNNSTGNDYRVSAGIGNFGVVFCINPYNKNGGTQLKKINIGFGFNRQNDFNNRVVIHGINRENSMMQSYVNTMNNNHLSPSTVQNDPATVFDLGLAYGAYLIGYDTDSNRYFCDTPNGGVMQDKTILTSGSMNEFDISVGANINEKLFFGATVGIPSINYYENSSYTETAADPRVVNFSSLNYRYDLHTRGTGVNLKVGVIYKPVDWVRVGASIHTPTWYPNMRDEWSSSMQSIFKDSTYWNSIQYSPIGTADYQLTTPFRAIGSIAFIIGQSGMISADYEYVNYSQARFYTSESSYLDTVNTQIRNSYQSWGNIRVGTEWVLSGFRLRGGFAYFSNPFKGNLNNSERFQVSGGVGYRIQHFFTDISYVWSKMNQDYYLYDPSMVKPASVTYYTNTLLATVGFRF